MCQRVFQLVERGPQGVIQAKLGLRQTLQLRPEAQAQIAGSAVQRGEHIVPVGAIASLRLAGGQRVAQQVEDLQGRYRVAKEQRGRIG